MKSLFDKLTGTVDMEDEMDKFTDLEIKSSEDKEGDSSLIEEENNIGELAVDVYDMDDKIIIKTMVAGVKSEDLDVSITRDMVTIKGTRQEESETSKEDYYHKELFWGTFARTIMLPAEIDTEESEAVEKHGLLILTLPKIDKDKKTKLKVK